MKQHSIAVEHWPRFHKLKIKLWLVNNFGVNGDRWGEQLDFDLENIWMDEDVYTLYCLKWL